MPKIKREDFANKKVYIGTELVQFDENGVGEIKSDELYNEVVTFPRFSAVGEEPKGKKEESKKKPVKKSVKDDKKIDEKKAEPKKKVEKKKEEKKSTKADTKAKSKK